MKKVVFFFLTISTLCNSQNINLNQGNTKEEKYYAEVEFEYINGKIIIPVKIENKSYRFLLDTGAPNCITKNLHNILKPTLIKKNNVTDAHNNKSIMNVVQIPVLEIGDIVFQNSVALSSNDEKNLAFDCFNLDGFIGSNMLRNSIIQIDIKKKILRITNDIEKLNFNKKNGLKISLTGNQSSPYIWIKLKHKKTAKEQVLLDTGMKGFYDISNRSYNLLKNEEIIKVINTGSGSKGIGLFGNAKIGNQLRVVIPEINILNSTFLNITTTTTNDENSRVGIGLFENGIGTLDYMNRKFYFDEYNSVTDLSEKTQGFSATILDNKLSIGIVWDENLKDKIYTGDEIIELNGINYENYQICDLISKKSIFKDIEIKEITIKSKDGELKKIIL